MSGIAAAYWRDKELDIQSLERMIGSIAHRGPDGRSIWHEAGVGLASCLLRSTPESMSEEGITEDGKGECRVIWDGRIDNREELLGELGSKDHLISSPDPVLLLAAYRRWGTECLQKIIGDFSFVLWDASSQSLFGARDRMGVKPFYYSWNEKDFFMGSEAKALFEALGKIPAADDEMIFAFLACRNFKEADHGRSFFEGIKRLPPAHFLLIRDGKMKIERYWDFDPGRITRFQHPEEYFDRFRTLFREAVRSRLRSNVPAAFFLSGGLDSSAVACTAAKIYAEEGKDPSLLEAVNLFSDDVLADERVYVQEVAQKTGIRVHSLFSFSPNPLEGLDESLWRAEAPFVSTSRNRQPFEFLQNRGLRVVLTGDAGDHLLDEGGYLGDYLGRMRFLKFFRETAKYSEYLGESFRRPKGMLIEIADLTRCVLGNVLPPSVVRGIRRMLKRVPQAWIREDRARQARLRERIFGSGTKPRFDSHGRASVYASLTNPYFILQQELEERVHAFYGLDIRFPMRDSRLAEYVLSIPWQERATGERKRLVRRSLEGIVPEKVLMRKDKGCTTKETDDALRILCRQPVPEPLQNRSGRMQRYVHLEKVRDFVHHFLTRNKSARFEIWFLIAVDHWLKRFTPREWGQRREDERKEIEKTLSVAVTGEVR